jgi:hypothetical protein
MPHGKRGTVQLSLVQTCQTLHISYLRGYKLALTAQLDAEQDRRGHWWVTRISVERMRKQLAAEKNSARPERARRSGATDSDAQGRRVRT